MTIISQKAEYDIIEAIAHYAKIDEKLGVKFREEIQTTINSISKNPLLYPIVYTLYRRALMRGFPFAVYYTIETNKDIIIDAVLSQRINTKTLPTRLT